MKNIDNKNVIRITDNVNELLDHVYKKAPKTKKIIFDELRLKFPGTKTYSLIVKDYKNMRKVFYFLFANIDKKPFTTKEPNKFAFETLWIILDVLEQNPERSAKFRKKELFENINLYSNVANVIKFGRYVFTIPKYKKFTFDVKGYGLATLSAV